MTVDNMDELSDIEMMQRWPKHVSVPANLGRCYHPAPAVLGDEGCLMESWHAPPGMSRHPPEEEGEGGGTPSTLLLVMYSRITAHADAIECSVLFPPPILLYPHL